MIINVKYFFEKTNEDYKLYNSLWESNLNRLIILSMDNNQKNQIKNLIEELTTKNKNNEKDIILIQFPTKQELFESPVLDKLLVRGESITYGDNNWRPSEIWIYNL